MIMYEVSFDHNLSHYDILYPDVTQAVDSLNRQVAEESGDLYHTTDESKTYLLLLNAEKLMADYALKEYIKATIETVEIEDDED